MKSSAKSGQHAEPQTLLLANKHLLDHSCVGPTVNMHCGTWVVGRSNDVPLSICRQHCVKLFPCLKKFFACSWTLQKANTSRKWVQLAHRMSSSICMAMVLLVFLTSA